MMKHLLAGHGNADRDIDHLCPAIGDRAARCRYMKRAMRIREIRALTTSLMLTLLLIVSAPEAVFAAGNVPTFTIKQVFTTSSTEVDDTFLYRLTPLDLTHPMPHSEANGDYLFNLTGTESVELGPIVFTHSGFYRYELAQVISQRKSGYTYDTRVYIIEAQVAKNLETLIVIYSGDGEKVEAAEFHNAYYALPTDRSLMVDPPVKKTINGYPLVPSTFTFRLIAKDPSQPMPPDSLGGVKTMSIVGAGEVEFGWWSYVEVGVYVYTISEVNAGQTGYEYDSMVYTITDTVTDEGGQLVLSREVVDALDRTVTVCAFTNVYTGTWSPASPKTGDLLRLTSFIILLIMSSVVYLAVQKRYRVSGGR